MGHVTLTDGFHLPFQVISTTNMPSLGLISDRVLRKNKPINAKSQCGKDRSLQQAVDHLLLMLPPSSLA